MSEYENNPRGSISQKYLENLCDKAQVFVVESTQIKEEITKRLFILQSELKQAIQSCYAAGITSNEMSEIVEGHTGYKMTPIMLRSIASRSS